MAQTYVVSNVQKGNFDGLVDFLKRVAYEETPFLNACGKSKAIATTHKWVSEDLNVAKSNARTEGFSASYAAADVKKRVLESNEVENIAREFSFSDSQERVKKAGGITSDYDHEKLKKIKEVSLDLDYALLVETLVTRDADAGTAGAMGGVLTKIAPTTDAGASIITTGLYDSFVQTLVDGGANPDAIWCAGFNRRVISEWALPQRQYVGGETEMTNVVLVYNGSWGKQRIEYDKHITVTKIAILQMNCMRVAYLGEPISHTELDGGGDLRKGFVKVEATLEYGSTKAGGIITNTATGGV